MNTVTLPRRRFLQQLGAASSASLAALSIPLARGADSGRHPLHLSTNQYSWYVFYQRAGRNFGASLDEGLGEVAASGINGFEPSVSGPAEIERLVPLLKKHGLDMHSIYVGSTLHQDPEAEQSIRQILAIARVAKPAGTRIIVTNPNPLSWDGTVGKSDAQLRFQAAAINRLGRELAAMGLTLAYHNHTPALAFAAREFHHMMLGTDPRYLSLCLDAHWVYRGSGNSEVALFDDVKLYGRRVKEIHLRQSQHGIWSETLGPGDIDYPALANAFERLGVKPNLVLEIAIEKGTPNTLSPLEAHRRSAAYARKVFAKLAG